MDHRKLFALPVVIVLAAFAALFAPLAGSAHAAATVSYDASSGGKCANCTTLTWTHTVSGTNTALLAGAGIGANPDSGCSVTATDNGAAMTSEATEHSFSSTRGFEQVFGLGSPPAGVNTIVVTVTGCSPAELTGESESFNGSSGTFSGIAVQSGNGPSPSITTAGSTSGGMYAGFIAAGHAVSGVNFGTSRQIENQDNATGAGNSAASTIASSGSGVQLGWSLSAADYWGIAAVQVNAGTSSPPPPTGPITSVNNTAKCVDDAGNSSTAGAKVQLWDCLNDSAQQWTVNTNGTITINGLCLDVAGQSVASNARVDVWTCNGAANQQWTQAAPGGQLVGTQSGKCLDDPASNVTNGTQLDIYTCTTGAANEEWNLPSSSSGGQQAPVAVTQAATGVTSSAATLNGTVNPEAQATTYQFQYGTTTSYGTSVPAAPGSAGSGSAAVPETANLTGLAASTLYHYRITATNATGTANGADQTFTTASNGQMPAPPGYTTKVFEDQFAGTTLDSTKWVTYFGAQGARWNDKGLLPSPYSGPNTPGNANSAMLAPSQVSVNNGVTLTAQQNTNQWASTFPWISGILNTEGKFSLPSTSAWYVQAKIQMPDTSQGMWPALWFLPGSSGTASNELDGWEGGFHELSGVPANQTGHYDFFANQGQQASEQNIGVDVSQGYHTYGVAFVPGQSITYYFDGVQKFQILASNGVTITGEPYEIMVELQTAATSTSGYHTVPNANTPPTSMKVAEVQAYTP